MYAGALAAGKKGFEPCTFGFGDQCSTIETIFPMRHFLSLWRSLEAAGAAGAVPMGNGARAQSAAPPIRTTPQVGLEPTALWLTAMCSTTELLEKALRESPAGGGQYKGRTFLPRLKSCALALAEKGRPNPRPLPWQGSALPLSYFPRGGVARVRATPEIFRRFGGWGF